jgi:hypothetical protein
MVSLLFLHLRCILVWKKFPLFLSMLHLQQPIWHKKIYNIRDIARKKSKYVLMLFLTKKHFKKKLFWWCNMKLGAHLDWDK